MFQDAVSAAGGRIEHDRCQRQMKGERDSVRNKRCEQQRSSTQISNGVKGNVLCAKRADDYVSRRCFRCRWQNRARPLPEADEGRARFREKQEMRAAAKQHADFERS